MHVKTNKEERAGEEREAVEQGERRRPVPHIRRAHWHSFWKGPRKEEEKREIVFHWIPPLPVGYKVSEDIVPTIHPVR